MSSIDERIVEMQFNNKDFEEGIRTTLESLERLEKGLEMTGAIAGLNEVSESATKLELNFGAVEVAIITAVSRITNAVIDLGKNLIDTYMIQPPKQGFTAYESQINATKAVMDATGKSAREVDSELEKLIFFADETSYSFDDMVLSVSKFTGSGVELGMATTAMQGIASAAALAGVSTTNATTAYDALSKSIGMGNVRLREWQRLEGIGLGNSIEFKQTIIDRALEMGKLVEMNGKYYSSLQDAIKGNEKAEVSVSNFGFALKDNWFDVDLLMNVLGEYGEFADEVFELVEEKGITATDAIRQLSSETQTLGERGFRAAQEAKTLSDVIEALQGAVSAKWRESFKMIIGDVEEATELWTEVVDALWEVIVDPGDERNEMIADWLDLGGREEMILAVANAFESLMSILEPIQEAFRDIFPKKTGEEMYNLTVRIKEFTESLILNEDVAENLKDTFRGFFAVIDIGKMIIEAFLGAIGSVIGYLLPVGDGVLSLTGSFGNFLTSMRDLIKESDIFNEVFRRIGNVLKPVADLIKIAVETIFESIGLFKDAKTDDVDEYGEKLTKSFQPFAVLGAFIKGIFETISKIAEKISPVFKVITDVIGQGLALIRDIILRWSKGLKLQDGLNVFGAGLLTAITLGIRKFIGSLTDLTRNVSGIVDGIKGIFGGITGSLKDLQSSLKAKTLIQIATAIAILTASVMILSMLDVDQMARALTAVTLMLTELFVSMAVFEKIMGSSGFKSMTKVTIAMLFLSTSVLILAGAMKKLGDLEWDQIGRGLVAIGVLMAELILAVKLLPNEGKLIKGAGGLVIFAIAISILATSVKKLGNLDLATLTKGLVGVGVLLTELSLFMKFTDLDGMGVLKGVGLMAMATAMVILASAVKKLGMLDTNQMIQGLAGLGAVLFELSVFMNVNADVKKVISTGIGLTILATAMVILAQAIKTMGNMEMTEIAKGLGTMAGALIIVTVALHALKGTAGGAASLLIFAAALTILTPALAKLGKMSLKEIVKSLTMLAGTFTVLGVAALVMAPVIPALLGLAGAMVLVAGGVTLLGVGLGVIAAGILALSTVGATAIAGFTMVIKGLMTTIPFFFEQVGLGIVAFFNVLIKAGGTIQKLISATLLEIATAIIDSVPIMVEALMTILRTLLNAIVEFIPLVVQGGIDLILALLRGISDNIGEVVETAIMIIVNFLDGIANMLPEVIDSGFKLMISFIDGLAAAIEENSGALIDAIWRLVTSLVNAGIDTIKSSWQKLKDAFKWFMEQGFGEGVNASLSWILEKAKEIPTKVISTLSGWLENFIELGKDLIGGIATGIAKGLSSVVDAAVNVARSAWEAAKSFLGIKSPSRLFATLGEYSSKGLAVGLEKFAGVAAKAATNVGQTAKDALFDSFGGFTDILDQDIDMEPTIRPVIDLTDVDNDMNRLFSQTRDIQTDYSRSKAASVSEYDRRRMERVNERMSTTSHSVENEFNIQAVIREESDIPKLAQELYKLQSRNLKGRGLAYNDI